MHSLFGESHVPWGGAGVTLWYQFPSAAPGVVQAQLQHHWQGRNVWDMEEWEKRSLLKLDLPPD